MRRPDREHPDLADVRERVARFLLEQFGAAPTDGTGDFMVSVGNAVVWIRPEMSTGKHTLVRVWSITNVEMRADARLGRFLLGANARLPFGGLRLDERRPAVVYSDALLGDFLNKAELIVAVAAAAGTAAEFAPRIKESFGGRLFTEI